MEYDHYASTILGGLYFSQNQPDKARDCLDRLHMAEKTGTGQQISFHLAYLYAVMNEPDKMFHYLNKSIELKNNHVLYILGYPNINKYKTDPRFGDCLIKIGIRK